MQTVKINDLPSSKKLTNNDLIPLNQEGDTNKLSLANLKVFAQGDLPERIDSAVNEVKEYVDQSLSGRNEWLSPVNTVSQLKKTGLDKKINYLCKVIADPSKSGVYQAVAGWTTSPNWLLFDDTVDLVNEQELATSVNNHNTNKGAHADIREKITGSINEHNTDENAHISIWDALETETQNKDKKITESINAHNENNISHTDVRTSITDESQARLSADQDLQEQIKQGDIDTLDEAKNYTNDTAADLSLHIDGIQTLQLTGALLTRVINGTTPVAKNLFNSSTVFIDGKTLIADENGTIGVYAGDVDSAIINIETKTISPVSPNEPTLLGSVTYFSNMPLTVVEATTKGWNTPRIDDYATVLNDETQDNMRTEWYVIAIDSSGDITWGNPVVLNTSDYQAQTTAQDSGKVLTGGAAAGTFGRSLDIDTVPTQGSNNLISSGAMYAAFRDLPLIPDCNDLTLLHNKIYATGSTTLNCPVNASEGMLLNLVRSNNNRLQFWYRYRDNMLFHRSYNAVTPGPAFKWNNWERIANEAFLETRLNYTSTAKTIDTSMEELQATINGLPKHLRENVTIRVKPGTITANITVERFYGPGSLVINAVDANNAVVAAANVQTHKLGRFIVQNNNLTALLTIQGFTSTTTDNICFYGYRNTNYTLFNYCNAAAGVNTNTALVGFYANECSGITQANECTVSNKFYAFRAAGISTMRVAAPHGTANSIVYRAEASAKLAISSAGDVTGTSMYSRASSGVIIPTSNILEGHAPLASPNFTGTVKVPNKTGSAVNNGTLVATEAQVYNFGRMLISDGDNINPATPNTVMTYQNFANNLAQSPNGTLDYFYCLTLAHGNSDGYFTQLAFDLFKNDGCLYMRKKIGGTLYNWKRIVLADFTPDFPGLGSIKQVYWNANDGEYGSAKHGNPVVGAARTLLYVSSVYKVKNPPDPTKGEVIAGTWQVMSIDGTNQNGCSGNYLVTVKRIA
jgi:hypothetical protein